MNRDAPLKRALIATWPDNAERAVRLLDLFTGLLEAERWRTCADLMRAVGMSEGQVWMLVENAAEKLDVDPGEVFQILYEPEDLNDG